MTVISIRSITRTVTNDEIIYESTACAQRLATSLREIYKGDIADCFGWLRKLQPPSHVESSSELCKTNGGNDFEFA